MKEEKPGVITSIIASIICKLFSASRICAGVTCPLKKMVRNYVIVQARYECCVKDGNNVSIMVWVVLATSITLWWQDVRVG